MTSFNTQFSADKHYHVCICDRRNNKHYSIQPKTRIWIVSSWNVFKGCESEAISNLTTVNVQSDVSVIWRTTDSRESPLCLNLWLQYQIVKLRYVERPYFSIWPVVAYSGHHICTSSNSSDVRPIFLAMTLVSSLFVCWKSLFIVSLRLCFITSDLNDGTSPLDVRWEKNPGLDLSAVSSIIFLAGLVVSAPF